RGPSSAETCGARRIRGAEHRERERGATRRAFFASRGWPPGETTIAQNGHVRADESGVGGVRRADGFDLLHERADLFFGRTASRAGATLLRHAGAGRIPFPGTFGIDFEDAGEISGHCA